MNSISGFSMIATVCMFAMPAVAAEPHDVNQPYSAERSNPVVWDGELVVTVTAPYKTKLLRVWIPIPPSDNVQEVQRSELSAFPVDVKPQINTEPVFGNRFAYFEFPDPLGAQVIRHRLTVKTHELHWRMDPEKVATPTEWPKDFQPYLRSEGQAVVFDDAFQALFRDVVPNRRGPLLDLDTVLSWADANLTYDHGNASLKASSAHAAALRRGHCSDYHGFCAAMGRVMSLPTRVTYGINPFPKASPSHCKLETFLPPYGWVSFDVSETQKLTKLIRADQSLSAPERDSLVDSAHTRLMGGFRDNTWFLQTRGTDYELAPKASQKVAVVRTIYAEADGKPLPDPDPSNPAETQFAWMTAHQFDSDVPMKYPFANPSSLQEKN